MDNSAFLSQAQDARRKTYSNDMILNFLKKNSKPCQHELTDKEANCYLDRYPDLKDVFGDDLKKAKLHWKNIGCKPRESRIFECPSKKCLKTLTDEDARCYLNNYSDLKDVYGDDLDSAKTDWKYFGCTSVENRTYSCLEEKDESYKKEESANNIIKAYNRRRIPYEFNKGRIKDTQMEMEDLEGNLESSDLELNSNYMEYMMMSIGGLALIIVSLRFLK